MLIIFCLVLLFALLVYFVARNIKSKADLKTLSSADKIGIMVSVVMFIIMALDLIDIYGGNYIINHYREIFFLINSFEFFCWLLIIPALFFVLLVALIRSIKNEKKGCIVALVSLFYALLIWLVTISAYAYKF